MVIKFRSTWVKSCRVEATSLSNVGLQYNDWRVGDIKKNSWEDGEFGKQCWVRLTSWKWWAGKLSMLSHWLYIPRHLNCSSSSVSLMNFVPGTIPERTWCATASYEYTMIFGYNIQHPGITTPPLHSEESLAFSWPGSSASHHFLLLQHYSIYKMITAGHMNKGKVATIPGCKGFVLWGSWKPISQMPMGSPAWTERPWQTGTSAGKSGWNYK